MIGPDQLVGKRNLNDVVIRQIPWNQLTARSSLLERCQCPALMEHIYTPSVYGSMLIEDAKEHANHPSNLAASLAYVPM